MSNERKQVGNYTPDWWNGLSLTWDQRFNQSRIILFFLKMETARIEALSSVEMKLKEQISVQKRFYLILGKGKKIK